MQIHRIGRPGAGIAAALLALTACLAPGFVPASRAGDLHPEVAAQMDRLAPGESMTALVVLETQARIPAIDHALKVERAGRAERHRRVIDALRRTARVTQAPLLDELESLRARGEVQAWTPYWIANIIRVTGTRDAISRLAARADVAVVEPRERVRLIDPVWSETAPAPIPGADRDGTRPSRTGSRGIGVTPGLRAIGADRVWSELGINGQGALIGGLDTGVDGNHPALGSRWRGNNGHDWQACWLDVLGTNTQYPTDTGSHGTHTMGTMTGLGAATGDTIGVAWGAQWIAANAIGQGANADFDTDIIACYQWFADPDGDLGTIDDVPDVVQNSWGVYEGLDSAYVDCFDLWWTAIDNCEAAGVAIIFSAGNEGPNPGTLRSPSDRATTPYNVFSVGAVDATNYAFPYPIEDFSSRGPTLCPVSFELLTKPEVSAPGDSVYSCTPNGLYGLNSGTSMAGPHVSGVVTLMRAANPDIDVDTIKEILLQTSRDEGAPGEDNDYGWGCIDAYEAVLLCLGGGYGSVAGTVINNDGGGIPVPFARIHLLENNRAFTADIDGQYWGLTMPGTYTLEASHPSFAAVMQPGVEVLADQTTVTDFGLEDVAAPVLTDRWHPQWIENPALPVPVRVDLTDFSPVPTLEIRWRVDVGSWSAATMNSIGNGRYEGFIPGQPVGSRIDYYLRAVDAAGNQALDPPNAPASWYEIPVQPIFFADDAETDQGWVLVQSGDATNGRWVRHDPYGTLWQGMWIEPADDHTAETGTACFVTGAGSPNGTAGQSDVDNGCVTLTSPTIDLSSALDPILTYWRWFALGGPQSGSFEAKISNNNGTSWTTLETLSAMANEWTIASFDVEAILPLTSQMKLRFIACDTATESLVEAAVDDIAFRSPVTPAAGLDDRSGPARAPRGTPRLANRPNPFARETELRFRIGLPGEVSLVVYDCAGRKVRTLINGRLDAGEHAVRWDGRDDGGRPAASGVYFHELRSGESVSERKLLLLRD